MKAWFLDGYTGIQSLRLAEAPDPQAKPGEVLLRVLYAGLNPADSYLASRQYPMNPTFPHILGRDGLGAVVALGSGMQRFDLGQLYMVLRGDVGGTRPGTFAELVSVPADSLVPKPAEWTNEQSGGATLVYLTAYQALTMWGPLRSGAFVHSWGACGGVGVAAVQLARALGYTAFGFSRSAEKGARLLELGASAVYNPEEGAWDKDLKRVISPERVDLIIDNIGGRLLPQTIALLGDEGKVSLVGRLAGPVPEFNTATLFFRRIRMGGVAVGAYTREEAKSAWNRVVTLLAATGARPVVDHIFPFSELPKAFERLASGPLGKVLVKISSD
jgi:NADPH2:quinone reductase